MKTLKFCFKEYTPLEIKVDENSIDSLNAILGYISMGAKVTYNSDTEYFLDMSFEDKPISIKDWFKLKWFLIKLRFKHGKD